MRDGRSARAAVASRELIDSARRPLEPAAEEEDRRSDAEEDELQTDIPAQSSGEETRTDHDEPQELECDCGCAHQGSYGASEIVT